MTRIETRQDLAQYLRAIDLYNPAELQRRLDEIVKSVRGVMGDIPKLPENDALRIYYESKLIALEKAYERDSEKGSVKDSAEALVILSVFLDYEERSL